MSGFDQTRCVRPIAFAFLAAGLTALTAASAAAPAAGATAKMGTEANVASDVEKGFDELDTNADGMISRDEAEPDTRLAKTFRQYDRNNDGTISLTEWNRFCADVNAAEPGLAIRDSAKVANRK